MARKHPSTAPKTIKAAEVAKNAEAAKATIIEIQQFHDLEEFMRKMYNQLEGHRRQERNSVQQEIQTSQQTAVIDELNAETMKNLAQVFSNSKNQQHAQTSNPTIFPKQFTIGGTKLGVDGKCILPANISSVFQHIGESSSANNSGNRIPWMPKLELTQFMGTNFRSWHHCTWEMGQMCDFMGGRVKMERKPGRSLQRNLARDLDNLKSLMWWRNSAR
ncbi:conserved hypothetical protein [Ricinus communis]|uniref:Uncharacterized protein n=1 Tax=Ricinus communis TaxID=3988 RepID=B9SUJ1_RICCO|nr:conserved hypothetical protein [Ricinus communis]